MVLVRLLPFLGCDARRLVRLRRQLNTRPLNGRRSQGASVAMAKLHPATATAASLCWNRGALLELGFFCSVHHFVLLQPLCFLLPSPFVFDEHLRFCWNWCPCLLQPAGVCATRSVPRRGSYIQQQGVLYPTPFERRELQPATGGAVRVGRHFFADAIFAEPIFLFLLEPVYFFCWNQDNFLLLWIASLDTELSNTHVVFVGT
ncbi:hypothetical protein VPH35_121800 [Triticum aestivum]